MVVKKYSIPKDEFVFVSCVGDRFPSASDPIWHPREMASMHVSTTLDRVQAVLLQEEAVDI